MLTSGYSTVVLSSAGREALEVLRGEAAKFFAAPLEAKLPLEECTTPFQGGTLRAFCRAKCGRERLELRRQSESGGGCVPPGALPDDAFCAAWDALEVCALGALDEMGDALGATVPLSSALASAAASAPPGDASASPPLHPSSLRLNHYGAGTGAGCPTHTDVGVVTLICNSWGTPGLELLNRDGEWVKVEELVAPDCRGLDSIVLIAGDTLERWSGGAVRALPHRVVTAEGAADARLSISFHLYAPS